MNLSARPAVFFISLHYFRNHEKRTYIFEDVLQRNRNFIRVCIKTNILPLRKGRWQIREEAYLLSQQQVSSPAWKEENWNSNSLVRRTRSQAETLSPPLIVGTSEFWSILRIKRKILRRTPYQTDTSPGKTLSLVPLRSPLRLLPL